jgi:hypothetical protein
LVKGSSQTIEVWETFSVIAAAKREVDAGDRKVVWPSAVTTIARGSMSDGVSLGLRCPKPPADIAPAACATCGVSLW